MAIRAALEAASEYRLGESIELRFELYNDADEDEYVLIWDTPLEGLVSDCLEVTYEGETLRYDGMLVKRGPPSPESYVELPARESMSRVVDLSAAYPVVEPGVYSVRLATELRDHVAAGEVVSLEEHLGEARSGRREPLEPARVQFRVVRDRQPKRTLGEQARGGAPPPERPRAGAGPSAGGGAKSPKFKGGDRKNRKLAGDAHDSALPLMRLGSDSITADASRYEIWFGKKTNGRRKAVEENYRKMIDTIQSDTYTYDLTGSGCKKGWLAYTYAGTRQVWLCDGFWKLPASGADSRAGTILHEHSHAAADTEDHEYGCKECREFARTKPKDATDNADNYQYHSEDASCS